MKLLDPYDNPIELIDDPDPNQKIEFRRENRKITIIIRNIESTDAGQYTLVAFNYPMVAKTKLTLRVRGNMEAFFTFTSWTHLVVWNSSTM